MIDGCQEHNFRRHSSQQTYSRMLQFPQFASEDFSAFAFSMVIFPQHAPRANNRNLLRHTSVSLALRLWSAIARVALLIVQLLSLLFLVHTRSSAESPPTDRIPIQAVLVKAIEAG